MAVALLGGLYWALEGLLGKQDATTGYSDSFRLVIPLLDPAAPPHAFEHGIEDFPIFRAVQGHTLSLTIRSERPGSVHVHGYDRFVDLVPHHDVTLTFEAKDAGLYPVHLHGEGDVMEHLATFEIQPK
jgi:hypothetical protein